MPLGDPCIDKYRLWANRTFNFPDSRKRHTAIFDVSHELVSIVDRFTVHF